MAKKNELDVLIKKYQPMAQKAGKQLAKAVKVAEEDISKMYKVAQTHVEIQMKNIQKEKLYHEIGKYVADRISVDKLKVEDLDKYKKRLGKIESEGKKIKNKLKGINAPVKKTKKKTAAKTAKRTTKKSK